MPYTTSITVSPQFKSGVNLNTLIEGLRRESRGAMAEAFAQLQIALFNVERVLRTPVETQVDLIEITGSGGASGASLGPGELILYDANGIVISRLNSALALGGVQVVGARGAAVAKVTSGPAGAAYGATEQTMLNDLKTALNLVIDRLGSATGHGLIA